MEGHFTKGKFTKDLLTCKELLQCGSFCWWTSKADVLHVYGTINEIVNFVEWYKRDVGKVSVVALNIEVIIIHTEKKSTNMFFSGEHSSWYEVILKPCEGFNLCDTLTQGWMNESFWILNKGEKLPWSSVFYL